MNTAISIIIFAIFGTFVSSSDEIDFIRIENSGSSNTAAYTIELQRNGQCNWTVFPRNRPILSTTTSATTVPNSIQLLASRTNSIFQAVERAAPFNQYAPIFCIKSVSFGTSLHVTYNGQQTPDLNCPLDDARLIVLSKYIHELIADLHINTFGR